MSGFLGRWSQRRLETLRREETPAEEEAGAVPAEAPEAAEPASELPAEEREALLAALPDLESITAETDIRPFLQKFVPAPLRNAALRRAWAADPVISTHLDVARDYAWDFNTGSGPVGYAAELSREIAQRSLDLLHPPVQPEVEEPENPEPAPEAEPEVLTEEQPTDPEPAEPPALRLALRHGGALPG